MFLKVLLFLFNIVYIEGLVEGDICSKDGRDGICREVTLCKSAREDIEKGKNPEICTFHKFNPIVCCFGEEIEGEGLTSDNAIDPAGTCIDLPMSLTSKRTGQKAFDKCIEYQKNYVFPCERTVALIEGFDRLNHCFHSAVSLIFGGTDAEQNEFPHMVMLGYGNNPDELEWGCGGSIISERFILTAGHCAFQPGVGNATIHALIGTTKLSESVDKSKLYKIKEIIFHPEFKTRIKYNDIALMRPEREIKLDRYTVPACLHVGDDVDEDQVTATGWGTTDLGGQISDKLQKVKLTKLALEECAAIYIPTRILRNGVDNRTHVCYGDMKLPKSICREDTGGPIQIESTKIQCMYTVVGIGAFGRGCGVIGIPVVYTRIAPYVSWIESVVWPN